MWLLPFLLFHCLNQIHHLRVKDKPSFGKSVNHCIVHFPIWLYTHFLHSIEKSKYLIQVTLFRIAKYHTRIRHYILLYVYICHLHPDTFSLLWAAYHIIPSVENNVEIFSVKRIHILVTVTKYAVMILHIDIYFIRTYKCKSCNKYFMDITTFNNKQIMSITYYLVFSAT